MLLPYIVLLSHLVYKSLTDLSFIMLLSYGTLFQLKCARLPPPLILTLSLLLSCRVLLFLHLSFTLVLKSTSSIIHILLSLLYLQDGYSGFRPGSPFISFSFSFSITHIHLHSSHHFYLRLNLF